MRTDRRLSRHLTVANVLLTVATSLLLASHVDAQSGSLFDPANARVFSKSKVERQDAGGAAEQVGPSAISFGLSKDNGPVLIKVASFIGEPHAQYAEALCKELRERHGLQAYTFRFQQQFDGGEGFMTDEEVEAFIRDYKVKPRRRVLLNEPPVNWAVFVGDFASFDDPAAQRTLDRVQKLDVKSVPANVWAQYRMSTSKAFEGKARRNRPLNSAMLVANPHPESQRLAREVSDDVKRMILDLNTNAPFSIYENRYPYTLAVAQFQGGSNIGESGGRLLKGEESPLHQAGQQAISIAEALRKLGWPAFVFHGQYGSIVCVGGFQEKSDLKDPRMQDVRMRLLFMTDDPDVVNMRNKLAHVTLGGMVLSPHAELILTPRPPQVADSGRAN